MNNTLDYYVTDSLLIRIGSTLILDSFHLFVILPLGLIGFVWNIYNFIIFFKINIKQTKLYSYLKVYSINSSLLCLIVSSTFISFSPRYLNIFKYYFSRIHRCFLLSYTVSTLYFIGNMLDIIIVFDRLSIFVKKFKTITQLRCRFTIGLIICISLIINLPTLFNYYVKSDSEYIQDLREPDDFYYCPKTNFFKSKIGFIVTVFQVLIRDVITLIFEIVLSIMCIVYHEKFSIKSKKIKGINFSMNTVTSKPLKSNDSNLSLIKNSASKKEIKGKLLLQMTIFLCLTSIISHMVVCLTFLFSTDSLSSLLFDAFFTSCLGLILKNLSNFFIFYFFNLNFRNKSLINYSFSSSRE